MKAVYIAVAMLMLIYISDAYAQEEPIIRFDKESYSPFDEVIITIIYDEFNRDPNILDKVRAVLSIDDRSMPLEIVETASNSNIFIKAIKLTPNIQLYAGDLQVERGDILTLTIEFGDQEFKESARIDFSKAMIEVDKDFYEVNEEAIVRVIEPDANKNQYLIDSITIAINTSMDEKAITLYETSSKSGIFEASVRFADIPILDSDIAVNDDDIVVIRYIDDTLPLPSPIKPDLVSTEEDIVERRVIITSNPALFEGYVDDLKVILEGFAEKVREEGGLSNILDIVSIEPLAIIYDEGLIDEVAESIVNNTALTSGDRAPITLKDLSRFAKFDIDKYIEDYKDSLINSREWSKGEEKVLLDINDLALKINWKSLNKEFSTIAVIDQGRLEFEPMMYLTANEVIANKQMIIVKNYLGQEVVNARLDAVIESIDNCSIDNANNVAKIDTWLAPLWLVEYIDKEDIFTVGKCSFNPEKDFECSSIEAIVAYSSLIPNWSIDEEAFRISKGNLPISSGFSMLEMQACPSTPVIETIRHAGSVFNIITQQSNISIEDARIDEDSNALVLSISAEQDGMLEIILPRELIDARSNDQDSEFMVLIDSEQAEFEELARNEDERRLRIQVPADSNEVRIIGTQVIPEFEFIVLLVLAIAITSAIAYNRLRFKL